MNKKTDAPTGDGDKIIASVNVAELLQTPQASGSPPTLPKSPLQRLLRIALRAVGLGMILLLFPNSFSVEVAGALGREGIIVLAAAWHIWAGVLLAFAMIEGQLNAKFSATDTSQVGIIIVGLFSAVMYCLAARAVLGKNKTIRSIASTVTNKRTLSILADIFLTALVFGVLIGLDQTFSKGAQDYFEYGQLDWSRVIGMKGLSEASSGMTLLAGEVLVQTAVGFLFRLWIIMPEIEDFLIQRHS